MKSTGMVRQIDPLGRVVLPKETRTILDMPAGTPLEFWVEDDTIILKKYSCAVCGGMESLESFRGQRICADCRAALVKQ